MRKILENPYLSLAVRLALGGIFIFWSLGKIADANRFAGEIMHYKMVPVSLVGIMALTMPWIELVCGILLIAGVRLKANAAIIGSLLIIFIIAIATAMARGLDIGCGCSTEHAEKVGMPKILQDLGMLIGAVYIYFFPVKKLTLEQIAVKEAQTA